MRPGLLLLCALLACACASEQGSETFDVTVDTESELAWRQYLANLELARGYEATCSREAAGDAAFRVIVTGFGRFMSNQRNASGEIVSELVGMQYPLTEAPLAGEIDPPGPQTAVAQETIEIEGAGKVSICAMVLPVFWDLAPVLVLEEAAAFEPHMVLMNGIAGARQKLWLELGAVNSAAQLDDGSGNLQPGAEDAPLIADAPAREHARPNYASWNALRRAVDTTLAAHAGDEHDGLRFGAIAEGVLFAGYPRSSNTYLCNNTTYTVGYLMDHPSETVRLLEASHVRDGADAGIDMKLDTDMWLVPRLFVHWPSDLQGEHLRSGAAVMRSLIAAQLTSLESAVDYPVEGRNDIAELN